MNTKSLHAMPKFPKLIGLIFFVFCFNLLSLHAQEDTCLRFEDLPANANYGKDGGHAPGDLAFSSNGVDVYLQEFLYSNTNQTGFFNASVEESIFGQQAALDGQSLFISNINLTFDFTKLNQAVNGLCFNIVDGGGEENIAVNGAPIQIIPDFSDVPAEIAPGVFLSVTPIQNPGGFSLNSAQVCIRGKIETLTIGGQEFAFDNLCYYSEPCSFAGLQAEIVNCQYLSDEVYVYELDISFLLQSTNNTNFDLYVNGDFKGFYNINELPLRVKEVRVLSTTENFEIQVCANDRPDCCASVELPNKGCPAACSIEAVTLGEIECSFDGFYYTKIETKGTNLSGKVSITNEAGETWTGPADGSEPVKFSIPDQQYDKWVVCDSENPDCCFTLDFDVPCTSCRIGPLQVSTSDCADDGTFYYKLDFDYLTPSGEFSVFVGDIAFAFAYEDLPVRVGPFIGDGVTKRNLVVLDSTGQCERDIDLDPVSCKPDDCEIGPLDISGPHCTPNGIFYFKLDFKYRNTSERFQVILNDEVFESYAYDDLPVRVGPLPADGTTDWQVVVQDQFETCFSETKFEAIDCQPGQCEIGDLDLSGPICVPGSTDFYFKLDFKYWNTSEKFDLFINGDIYESYTYEDLPIRVGPFAADATNIEWKIGVIDASEKCDQAGVLQGPICNPNQCEIGDLDISGPVCLDDGQFYFKLDFKYYSTSEEFQLILNDEVFESYAYADLPVRIGPLPADGQTDWLILVQDAATNCAQESKLEAVSCFPDECAIGNLLVSDPICTNTDGQFFFKLDFEYKNTSEVFKLFLNGELYEQYPYQSLPVQVGPLTADGTTDWHILVEDLSGLCKEDTNMEAVNCNPNDCAIGALNISEPICTDNGQFYFELNFEYKNTSDQFQLILNEEVYESYSYADLPIKVGPLPANTDLDWHILVRDLGGTAVQVLCESDAKLPAVNCTDECKIGELRLGDPICTATGQFYFELNFEHQHTSGKFLLYLNEDLYESYAYEDLPIKVGPLSADANVDWHVLVRDAESNSNNFCASDAKLPAVDCPGENCEISSLKISNAICTDDGQYFNVQLDFEHKNTSEKFQLYLNDELYGTFAYQELPLKVGPLNALIDIEWRLLVKDASGDCAADINFNAPNCNGNQECNLTNLKVERYPCIGGQFLVDLFFDIKNPGPLGFYVFANGKISGPHAYDQSFITLGPFPGDGTTTNDFLVIDIEDPSCHGYYELEPVDCSNPCTISDVFAEAHECDADGGFLVDIEFKYDKVGGSGFTIRGNGVEYGKFKYGEPFYTVGPLKGDGTTVYEFEIIDNDNPDCRNFTTIDPVNCLPPCSIGDLEYTVQCLENAKKFVLNLDFEYENAESDLFVLSIEDEVIGTFPYADLPLSQELELPEDGNLIVVVWDAKKEDCAQKAQFLIPCCYLSDPIVEAHPCENDGELWIDLDAKYYNVSETFQLVYGPVGGEMHTKVYAYSDLPLNLGPLPGQATEDWYFEITDQGFYCQSSTYYGPDYCDNDACAEWDQTPTGAYGPLTGYQPGDEIAEEDDIRLSFAPTNQPDCNCSVFIMKASTFPVFKEASGHVVLLDNSGALISAPGYEIQSLSVDYYFTGNEVLLKINNEETVAAATPTDLPEDIASGVKLEVSPNANDGRRGTMHFTGKIQRLTFMSRGPWVLDNFCTDKSEKEEAVWPGDTNSDNVANHIDLLNIGLAFGEQGPPRANIDNISWEAQQSEDWADFFLDQDLNIKHADADGDGTINRADRAPIQENYGLTHGPLPVFAEVPTTDNDPPLYVDFESSTTPIPQGGTFQVPIVFGTETQVVEDIYGLAFSIIFDPEVINPESIEVVYPDSWFGETDKNLLTLDRTLEAGGRIDVALTRIDKENAGGFGPIASLIGAIDDIAGKYTEVGITEVVAITANEDRIPVNGIASKVEFTGKVKPDVGYIDINASLNIFPNPTISEVIVTTKFNFPIEGIRVLDSYGNPTGLQVSGQNRINLESLPAGIYMLRIQLGEYTVSRKIVKVQ